MERYCKNRFPDETFRFGKILLKLMGLRAVNADDLEFLFFSKMLHHSSIAGVIRNQLVSDLPSPGHTSPYRETSFKSTCQWTNKQQQAPQNSCNNKPPEGVCVCVCVCGGGGGGYSAEFLVAGWGGGVQLSSSNPDPISDHNM